MKIKIFGKRNLRDVLLIILVSIFCWIFLRAILPRYPKDLMNDYRLCDTPYSVLWSGQPELSYRLVIIPKRRTDHITISCKSKIPVGVLLRAKTIYVNIFSNQEADLTVFLHRNGSGGMYPSSQRIFPESSTSGNLVTFDLDSINNPKINWLTGDYDEIIFEINNFKSLDSIQISIQKVYLK